MSRELEKLLRKRKAKMSEKGVSAVQAAMDRRAEAMGKSDEDQEGVGLTEDGKTITETELTEMSEKATAFFERMKKDDKRAADATVVNWYFCVYFQTREQKLEFLDKLGWLAATGLDEDEKMWDGMELAEDLGMKLESEVPKPQQTKSNKRWAALADPLDEP